MNSLAFLTNGLLILSTVNLVVINNNNIEMFFNLFIIQGFQIIFDNNGGFGGLTASTLAYLSDEFSSKSRFSIAVTPATPPDQVKTLHTKLFHGEKCII